MLSLISGCGNTPKSPTKDLCYGAHLEYFYDGINYSIEEKKAKVANNDFVCQKCINSLSHEEQTYCVD
jgi:hypothetical protein